MFGEKAKALGVKFVSVRDAALSKEDKVVALAGQARKDWINGIYENAFAKCKFMISRDLKKNKFTVEMLTLDSEARDMGLKFRKISANTLNEVETKFLTWIEKNVEFFNGEKV